MKRFLSIIPALFLLATINPAYADDVSDLKNEIQQLKQMLQHESAQRKALEAKVDGIEGRDEQLKQASEEGSTALFDLRDDNSPFSISGGVTGVVQGTSGNKNATSGTTDKSSFASTFDLSLNTRLSENQRFIVDLEAGHGNGVNGSVNASATPNFDPYNTTTASQTNVTISAMYYEGSYHDGALVVSLGKLNPQGYYDENNFANDETAQFLSSMFVMSSGTIFTDATDYYAPSLTIQYGVNDYLDVSLVGVSNNYDDLFSGSYGVAQINIKPQLLADREGNYRFYVHHDKRVYRNINTSADESQTSFGLSFDQELTGEIGVFARAAWQDKNVTGGIDVSSAYSGGINLKGSLWGRDGDEVGIAYGTLNYNNRVAAFANQSNENHFEIYYNAEILPQVHLSPDIQYIQNVTADNGVTYRDVTVYGVRGQFDF